MYICNNCGNLFEQPTTSREMHEVWGHQQSEEVSVCPYCGVADMSEARACVFCGEYGLWDDGNVCPDCAEEMHKQLYIELSRVKSNYTPRQWQALSNTYQSVHSNNSVIDDAINEALYTD